MSTPTKNNPALAKIQFKEDLELIPEDYQERYGWNLTPELDDLRLYADLWSVDKEYNKQDDFHIVMDMSFYRTWPPGVTFIDPQTKTFDPNKDMKWLPTIKSKPPGTDIHYHHSYSLTTKVTKQMICNSMFLEYYQSNHAPKPEETWDPNRHNLFASLSLLQMMLTEPYYGGRSH